MESRFLYTILLFLAAMVGGGWTVVSRQPVVTGPSVGLTEAPRPGFLAPDFTLALLTGESVAVSDLRGQPVILNFWATWCPPCRTEMPFFENAARTYNGRVTILGISQGEAPQTVADFAAAQGLTYPLLPDPDSAVNRLYAVRALPTTLFVDAAGVVRDVHPGIINEAVLASKIERLLSATP